MKTESLSRAIIIDSEIQTEGWVNQLKDNNVGLTFRSTMPVIPILTFSCRDFTAATAEV